MRSIWTGSISFGLVNVGVKAVTAVSDHGIKFNQIERGTGSRIGYQKVSKESGEPVEADDIVMGYELSKNQFVTFEKGEIEELKPEASRVIEISDFVELADIDPIFFNNTYWLAPTDEAATRSYALLVEVMKRRRRAGIGRVVMRNKEYLAAIRVVENALAMSTMRFSDEVVHANQVADIPQFANEPGERELTLATQIVDALASEWDPEQYHDVYTNDLRELIDRKAEGDLVTASTQEGPRSAKILDLMEALQASVEAVKDSAGNPEHKDTPNRAPAKTTVSRSRPAATKRAASTGSKKSPPVKKASTRKSA